MSLRILVSAYACEPGRGSEPGVGWIWALAAAQNHHITVITRSNNLPVIEAWERQHGATGIRWVGYDGPAWRCWLKKRMPKGDHWYYAWWQAAIEPVARRLHQETPFDAIHHVTFVTHQHPCFLHRIGPPLIFGPCAGADRIPETMLPGMSWRERISERLRDLSLWRNRHRACIAATVRKATCVLAANPANAAYLKRHYHVGVVEKPAMTVDLEAGRYACVERRQHSLVSAGRFIGLKAHWLTLRAFARLPSSWHLDLIGSGPDEGRLRRLALRLGVADRITWHPWMSQADLHKNISTASVFIMPSLRDSGGMAGLEALRLGCPVVALALGGFPLMVRPGENGFLIEPGDMETTAGRLAEACVLAEALSREGIPASVEAFTPGALAPWLADVYRRVVGGR